MTKRNDIKRALILFLCIAVATAFSLTVPASQASAAKKMKLPTKVTQYAYDGSRYVKTSVTTLKYYKNGRLKSATAKVYSGGTVEETYKYVLTYRKKGKTTKVKVRPGKGGENTDWYDFTLNKKGRISYVKFFIDDSEETYTYKYDKKGSIKSVKWTDNNGEYYLHKGTYTYKNTYKDGKLIRIKESGKDKARYIPDEDPANFEQTYDFRKNGLLISEKVAYYDDPIKYTYEISKKGYVKTKYCDTTDTYGDNGYKIKYVYKYGKIKAKKSKVYKMINKDGRVMYSHLANLHNEYVIIP